jgi:DNA processing protein
MNASPSRRELLIALNAIPSLSRPALYRLAAELERWAGPADPDDTAASLSSKVGVPVLQMARALAVLPAAADLARREIAEAERHGAALVTVLDAGYPPPLRQLAPPPPVLYIEGRLPAELMTSAVAVVGSRRADPYGREVAGLFAQSLAAAGVAVISGFALGVDEAAHRGALAAERGETVAVLGCGLGVDYPRGQEALAREIAGRGAVISEFPCGQEPRAWHFPVRNRVIAGLTAGTLVVQAAPRSGSLITARHALDLGREVWAVPGRIFDEKSIGPNALIRDGAQLVQHPRDILESLRPRTGLLFPEAQEPPRSAAEPPPPPGLPGEILAALPRGTPRAPEELAVALGTPVDRVLGALLELELGGWAKRLPGGAYGKA